MSGDPTNQTKMTVRQHCSEDRLLLYLDGELGHWERRLVDRHLRLCWECHSRLHSLHAWLILLMEEVTDWRAEDVSSIVLAKERFALRRRMEDREAATLPVPAWFGLVSRRTAILTGVLLTLLVALCLLSARPRRFWPWFADPWNQARRLEQVQASAPILRQRFSLQIIQTAPPGRLDSSIQILRDHYENRFTLVWRDSSGGLLYGSWRPAGDRELVYSSLEAEGLRQRRKLPLLNSFPELPEAATELSHIERGLANWLEGRMARPILLTEDCLLVSRLPGLRETGALKGTDGWAFEWAQRSGASSKAVILRLQPANFEPRSQTIILANSGRKIQVRIELLKSEGLDREHITPQAFEPTTEVVMASTIWPQVWRAATRDLRGCPFAALSRRIDACR
jgi:hypothetical protein